jgi:hypothetical protein
MLQTLVLNKGGIPINVVPWYKAQLKCHNEITLHDGSASTKAIAVMWHDAEILRIHGFTSLIPSVIQCSHSDYIPKYYVNILPFNRKNIFLRDKGQCMFCGKKLTLANFSFEHVQPSSRGGKTNWMNIVVSCLRCNNKKGNRTLDQAGMKLIRQPYIPRLDKAAPKDIINRIGANIPYETWTDYIYWHICLEQ